MDTTNIVVTFVGNATTLISYGDLTLLTDPNFLHRGQRAYLGYGLVSKRLREPAVTIDELPPLDAILLSHMHGDHWDRVGRKHLDHGLPVLTTPAAQKALRRSGFEQSVGLTTWDTHVVTKGAHRVVVTAWSSTPSPGASSCRRASRRRCAHAAHARST